MRALGRPLLLKNKSSESPLTSICASSCRVPASHQMVSGPETFRSAILRRNSEPSMDAGCPPTPGNRRDSPAQPVAGAQQIAALLSDTLGGTAVSGFQDPASCRDSNDNSFQTPGSWSSLPQGKEMLLHFPGPHALP